MMGYLLGSSVQLENEHLLHEVLSDVVKNKIFPEKVLCLFGKVLDKYKCYEIISDLKLSMELKTFIDLKENLSSSEEIKRIYFYILNYIPSVDNYKTKLDVEKFSTLKKETEVISMLNSRNFKGLNEFKWKENFDSTYGNGAGISL